jgi:hypothetical protein
MWHRSILSVLTVLFALGAATMPTPKLQCVELLNTVLPVAQKFLSAHSEFYPFGASMKVDGSIVMVAAYDGRDKPPSQPLIDLLRAGFIRDAKEGVILASATAYDVRVIPPGRTDKTDAVEIELDHRDSYSTVVFYPYSLHDGSVKFGEPFANAGEFRIFGKHGS